MSPHSTMVPLSHTLMAELVRRYWVLGIECSMLEVQGLAWLMARQCWRHQLPVPFDAIFQAQRYGPYADALRESVFDVVGNLLCGEGERGSDTVIVWLDQDRLEDLAARLAVSDASPYRAPIEAVDLLIDGFQSPLGMEALATLDWLISQEHVEPTVEAIKEGLRHWPDDIAGQRKLRLFSDRLIALALERLREGSPTAQAISTAL
ncbi:phosphate phosphatase [Billgrantia kenyensis]|uniref:Phosphate phosphatase n=1 Tax=Billgrantia kenyensis TaxID=321266 RepID=A0A7V9W3W9_9GAMM|nr:phosphate phosphatase [Halomonas kenyensis]MBA2780598.1 phosphate phosphatase [Halomonas kenyensis]MCG6663291.1 phosphate phosphatase [Halomonas kenyensis]